MPSGTPSDRGQDEAADHAPDRHADVLGEAVLREERPALAQHRQRIGEEGLRHEAAEGRRRSTRRRTRRRTRCRARPCAPGATGTSGFIAAAACASRDARAAAPHLDEPRVGELRQVRHLLDDADLEQQVRRFLGELRVLAGEELLVRRAVLPAQVLLRRLELLAGLLHVGAHDLEALLRVLARSCRPPRSSCRPAPSPPSDCRRGTSACSRTCP